MANTKSIKNILGDITYDYQTITNIWNIVRTSSNDKISFYDEYNIQESDRWDTISVKFYETPHLWWLICNYNKIKDPFTGLVSGTTIKIIKRELLSNIIKQLKGL